MTEDEAREKRCCGPDDCGAINYAATKDHGNRFCIASKCMAWRWEANLTRPFVWDEDAERWKLGERSDPQGHCGLAGNL